MNARVAAVCGALSAACAVANLALMASAVDFDLARLHAFAALHDVDERGARLLVASMVADVGYYLFLIPVALALGHGVARAAGVVYALLGAGGALTLAIMWPSLIALHDVARFEAVTALVYRDVWNLGCAFVGAVWWYATWSARRDRQRWFARLSLLLAATSACEGLLVALGSAWAAPVLNVELALLPVWAVASWAVLRR